MIACLINSFYKYNFDILLDKSYPLSISCITNINIISLSIKFKKFRHGLVFATILLLTQFFNKKININSFLYSDRSLNIEKKDFIGLQYVTRNEINKLQLIYFYDIFKNVPLMDDTIEYNHLYLIFFRKRSLLQKKLKIKLIKNEKNKLYLMKLTNLFFIFNKLKFFYILKKFQINKINTNIKIKTILTQFNLSMRNLISFYLILKDYEIVSYLFDRDLLSKEYNAVIQLNLNKKLNILKKIYFSYYLGLHTYYK
jgi:hypothetical protein